MVDLSRSAKKPKIGEVVSVIPNHCCVVTNMMDEIYAARKAGSRRCIRSRRAARCADVLSASRRPRPASIPPRFPPRRSHSTPRSSRGSMPSPTGLTIQEVRARRLQGLGAFPLPPKSPRAETIDDRRAGGKIDLRIIAPKIAARHLLPHPWRRLVARRARSVRSAAGALCRRRQGGLRLARRIGSRRKTPIRRARTTARRPRSGSCVKARSGSGRRSSRSAANRPARTSRP